MKITRILALASAFCLSNAWNLIYYTEDYCEGDIITFENITHEDATCHKPIPMKLEPRSVMISNLDSFQGYYQEEDEKKLRFYDTNDCHSTCNHRHVIAETDWNECVSWPLADKNGRKMRSFNLMQVGDLGMGRTDALSDGVCYLKHGDILFFRNQYWRMQQVAEAWFREIPEAEWNPSIHTQNTTIRFGQHGDVDAFGQYKLRSNWDWLQKINLEYWDEEKHSKQISYNDVDEPEYYDDLVWDLCEDATRDDVNRDMLLEKIPNVDEICRGWKNGIKQEHEMEQKGSAFESEYPLVQNDEELMDELK